MDFMKIHLFSIDGDLTATIGAVIKNNSAGLKSGSVRYTVNAFLDHDKSVS